MTLDASWIQSGELGLAFVIVILFAFIVRYILKQNAAREDKLMELLEKQQTISDRQGDILQNLADYVQSLESTLNKRIAAIEEIIADKLRARKREQ